MNARTSNIDPAIIQRATAIMESYGMSHDDTINSFYTQICWDGKLPIKDKIPNAETMEAMEDVEARRNLTEIDNLDDMFKDIG